MTANTKLRTRSLTLGSLLLTAMLAVPAQAQNIGMGGLAVSPQESAQPRAPRSSTRAFGTGSTSEYVLSAYGFELFTDASTYATNGQGSRYCTSGSCFFEAGVMIPSGSRIELIELDACDVSSSDITMTLFKTGVNEGGNTVPAAASTTGTGGCQFPLAALAAPETVDNLNNSYTIQVFVPDSTIALRFQAVRVTHRRQISPAPGTATFGDVSTGHPFFQHIEALFASGITAGCGGGNYCPDDPLTRGQMAVFLAGALGLHFPN